LRTIVGAPQWKEFKAPTLFYIRCRHRYLCLGLFTAAAIILLGMAKVSLWVIYRAT
jgi:hypothetical protein